MAQLLQNAALGTAVILASALLRQFLKSRLPPEVWLVLWAVCLFRLFTPAAPESALSVYAITVGFAAEPVSPQPNLYVPMSNLVSGNSDHIIPEAAPNTTADENAPQTELVAGADEAVLSGARSVSISTDFTVKVGASFQRSFRTNVLFGEDHDAFSIIVTDTNGVPYKMIAQNSNGWSDDTPELTGDQTWYFWNVSGNDTYTIYIQNLGTSELTGHVKISSYYYSDI